MKIESNLTVLICNYNHGQYINTLIQSILAQSLKPTKIIIIDDGSTDSSHKELQKYENNDLFEINLNFKNLGVIFRLNQGIKLVKTEYFMVYGADDIIVNKNAFEISINYLNLYKKAGLSSALVCELNNNFSFKKIIKTPIISNNIKFFSPKATLKEFEKYGLFINGHLTIIRTECFKKIVINYPHLDQMTDICAFYCIGINYGTIFIPKIFGGYRFQEDSGYAAIKFNKQFSTYKNIIKMLKIIQKKNYYNFDLSKLTKIIKLNAKLFFCKKRLKTLYKDSNSYSNFFVNFKFYIYFISLDKFYFLRYIKYKIKYFFFNEKFKLL
jgi:glycosyltransferase involved in cell wall biosynthesis